MPEVILVDLADDAPIFLEWAIFLPILQAADQMETEILVASYRIFEQHGLTLHGAMAREQ